MMKLRNKNLGFSLIEVAIAIVVIGLITGATLKGRELIHTAQLRSVIDQVNTFKIATQTFMDKYGTLPGDLSNAQDLITPSLENGRNDGKITSVSDSKRFWQHLIASGFITSETVNGFPKCKLGGYYTVISDDEGVWLVLSAGTSDNKSFQGVISEKDAYFLDHGNDTSIPTTGDIRTKKANKTELSESKYHVQNTAKDCIIYFRLW